ncbi:endogenous retrovirus group FC1 member 1 Env polyprotein-like [Lagenorhynchus albirostris]|uniref:endogenous retrovirus group FC1 member 1 Env polyprotein-like n=1 Tax=Lagenorhynchus albirostris TaxID=27610 RepID=UPI0028EE6FAB|nr:endogenous retrovirus group FC1 member 1 Env polyprotein-like [Lagenorhynchus albirostris]
MVAGISLASSLVAAGIGVGALTHSVSTSRDLEQKLQLAIEASAASITSLQRQITSVARGALQNRRALDLLMADKGGTCLFLQEECCYYINETGFEDNVPSQAHGGSLSGGHKPNATRSLHLASYRTPHWSPLSLGPLVARLPFRRPHSA